MKRTITAGLTSVSIELFIQDSTSSTGAGLTGLTHATPGLTVEYRRQGQASWVPIALTGSKTVGTWVSGGFVPDGRAGYYELDLPNLAVAAGARVCYVRLYGAANMVDCPVEIELNVVDYQTERMGAAAAGDAMALLPNQDVQNVNGTIPTVTLNANQPLYTPATEAQVLAAVASAAYSWNRTPVVERSVTDTNAITFAWPVSGATITAERSVNNGSYVAANGAVAFLRTESGKHYYTLAYNAADRLTSEGRVRYKFTDGTHTRYVVLSISFPAEAPTNWIKSTGIQDDAFTANKFAANSLSGKGDWATDGSVDVRFDALDTAVGVLQSSITALNNLSAKANWFGSLLLEVPDSGTRAYLFELVVRDDEDRLTNLDALPTIALTNTAGTDRSSLITTGIALVATGRYVLTVTVGTSTVNEALRLTATGTISGETRYAAIMTQVVDYDSATQINTILTRIGVPSVSLAADIATRLPSGDYVEPDNLSIADIKAIVEALPPGDRILISDGANGREVLVTGSKYVASDVRVLQQSALAQFATDDTGQVAAGDGSVAKLSQGGSVDLSPVLNKLPEELESGRIKAVSTLSAETVTYFDDKFEELAGQIQSAIGEVIVESMDITVSGFPKEIRKNAARTVANGLALNLKVYATDDVDHETPLLGVGTYLFENATAIKLGFLLKGTNTVEVVINVTWVTDHFLVVWDTDDFENATDHLTGSTVSHEWGLSVTFASGDTVLVASGITKIKPALTT